MTSAETRRARSLLARGARHARRAAWLAKERRREPQLARALRQIVVRWSLERVWDSIARVHIVANENSDGGTREEKIRPLTQRIRDHLDTAHARIGTRGETDPWFRHMCLSANGAGLCDDLDEDLEMGSMMGLHARAKRKHHRRNPPAQRTSTGPRST